MADDELRRLKKPRVTVQEGEKKEYWEYFLSNEMVAAIKLYESLQERALKHLVKLRSELDHKRTTELLALVDVYSKIVPQPEAKSEFRQKIEDLIWLVKNLVTLLQPQKAPLRITQENQGKSVGAQSTVSQGNNDSRVPLRITQENQGKIVGAQSTVLPKTNDSETSLKTTQENQGKSEDESSTL